MLEVQIKFRGSVRDVVQSKRDALELPDDATFRDLIVALVGRHGDNLAGRILTPDGKLQTYTHLFINGEEVDYQKPQSRLIDLAKGKSEFDAEIFVIQMNMGG